MNADILKGRWKQIRGQAKVWWGELTDDDLDMIDGRMESLVGVLQERYGYAKDAALKEIERRLNDYDKETSRKRGDSAVID